MAPPTLQAMDLTALRAVLAELRPLLVPSRFEKAQQSDAHTLQLGFRNLAGRPWLELSWLAEAPRLLAIEPPARGGDGSTLAQQLQHGLAGLALVELWQPGWERAVELRFAPRPGEPIQRTLVVELMGRHSNLFLLDEERRVVAAARQVRESQSRLRPIGTGDAYTPPPAAAGRPPSLGESFEHWQAQLRLLPLNLKRALLDSYQGVSPALALQLAGDRPPEATVLLGRPVDSLTPDEWQELWRRWRAWLSALEAEQFAVAAGGATAYRCWSDPDALAARQPATAAPEPPPAPAPTAAGSNAFLAAYHHRQLGGRQRRQRLHNLGQKLGQTLERERQQRQQQQHLLDQVENSDALQQQADALLCLAAPGRVQIDEAQRLYKRARKLRRSVAAITPRLEQHDQRLAQLEASLTYLDQLGADLAADPGHDGTELQRQLDALEEECEELLAGRRGGGRRERRAQRSGGEPQPLELRSGGGLRLQVGRNHRQNEWISLRQARRGDLWFHAQECPGSHVVLKGSEAPTGDADLADAAALAAHFSRARGNARVPVVMVPTEELQRIPGATAGTVRHRGGTVLWAEPGRALALLGPVPSLGRDPEP